MLSNYLRVSMTVLGDGELAVVLFVAITAAIVIGFGIAYVVFTKHGCTKEGGKCSAKLFLWTCMGCTACNQKCRKKGWWQEIDDRVYVGAVPLKCLGHVRKLHQLGVRGVVNTMDEYQGPVQEYQSFGIQQLYLPVIDHHPPSFHQTEKAMEFIQRIHSEGHSVFIHCKGGHGRSAAIAYAWLLKHRQMSLEEAQRHILSRRKVRKKLYTQTELIRFHRKYVLKIEDDGSTGPMPKSNSRRVAPSSSEKSRPAHGADGQELEVSHVASPQKRSKVVPTGGPVSKNQPQVSPQRESPRKKSKVMPLTPPTDQRVIQSQDSGAL